MALDRSIVLNVANSGKQESLVETLPTSRTGPSLVHKVKRLEPFINCNFIISQTPALHAYSSVDA